MERRDGVIPEGEVIFVEKFVKVRVTNSVRNESLKVFPM